MPSKQKHIPQRTCIVCRAVKDKRSLIRIVKTPEGTIIIDQTGKAAGRGAYICKDPNCWQKSLNQGMISRAFKAAISEEEVAALKENTAKLIG